MARFHFHTQNGEVHRDDEGSDLRDHHSARAEAMKTVGHTLIDSADCGGLPNGMSMNVTNADGLSLYRLEVAISESPAVSKS